MLFDELEIYRRGDADAPRPECCPPPFDPEFHNWMLDYPQAYVIPVGDGQRSDAEANRLVEWLLFNDIEVTSSSATTASARRRFEEGSYVGWLAQPRRGLLDTAMSIGVDISERIQHPLRAAGGVEPRLSLGRRRSHGPDGARFTPQDRPDQ